MDLGCLSISHLSVEKICRRSCVVLCVFLECLCLSCMSKR